MGRQICTASLSWTLCGQRTNYRCYPLDQHLYCKGCNGKRLVALSKASWNSELGVGGVDDETVSELNPATVHSHSNTVRPCSFPCACKYVKLLFRECWLRRAEGVMELELELKASWVLINAACRMLQPIRGEFPRHRRNKQENHVFNCGFLAGNDENFSIFERFWVTVEGMRL